MHTNQSNVAPKAAAHIVDALHGKNRAAGKNLPSRLLVGKDATPELRVRARKFYDICDE